MPEGYCETGDVQDALRESDSKFGGANGPLSTAAVEDEIQGASTWLRKHAGAHWYDSGGSAGDLVPTASRSISTVRLDVPSSPHRQDRQLFHDGVGVRYPVTTDGPYARLRLPHRFVTSVSALKVRDRGGGVTDWTAAAGKTEGVGNDWYVQQEDQEGTGASYLYLRASSIGARTDYGGLVVMDYDYGLDAQDESWDDVRSGVARLAAAQLIVDDNVLTQIPDNGQLVGVDTQADRLFKRAMRYLGPYIGVSVA